MRAALGGSGEGGRTESKWRAPSEGAVEENEQPARLGRTGASVGSKSLRQKQACCVWRTEK